MFAEIYVALQQGRVLQQRMLKEAGQARRWWLPTNMRRTPRGK